MSFNWLGSLLGSLLGKFGPLKNIQHWKIWVEMKAWYDRFKKWRDWYKQHVMAPMKQMQAMQRQLYNTFFKPLLLLVDHVRQLTSIIGIFNKKLADKLNYQFLRVESFILAPMNAMTSRVNGLGRAFTGILTPLGYLDRGTLLNSTWRDAGLIKEILHNPFEQHPAAATLAPAPTISDHVTAVKEYTNSGSGPYAADVNAGVLLYQQLKATEG
jgi:hypothetical protein